MLRSTIGRVAISRVNPNQGIDAETAETVEREYRWLHIANNSGRIAISVIERRKIDWPVPAIRNRALRSVCLPRTETCSSGGQKPDRERGK